MRNGMLFATTLAVTLAMALVLAVVAGLGFGDGGPFARVSEDGRRFYQDPDRFVLLRPPILPA